MIILKGVVRKNSQPLRYPCTLSCWDLGRIQAIIYISSEHNVSKNNKLFSTVLSWFDLAVTLRWPHHDLGITPLWNPTPTDVTMCTWIGFRPSYWKCWSNNLLSTILSWFDLAVTLRWPYHDLGITPPWKSPPTLVTMCTWLWIRPIYITHSYTTLRLKGTILRWPLVTLSIHRKSADHLKVTWYIIRLKKIWSTKIPRGEGFDFQPMVYFFLTWIADRGTNPWARTLQSGSINH